MRAMAFDKEKFMPHHRHVLLLRLMLITRQYHNFLRNFAEFL
jgi:hypothetical protein